MVRQGQRGARGWGIACFCKRSNLKIHSHPPLPSLRADPNGLFYDPVFKVYHLMYQYQTPRVWGHASSVDMVHWKQLPISLENDEWYDAGGVFTGSATVMNNDARTPVITYSVSTNDMQVCAR